MTRFYIIRHCEAAGNRERVFQGIHDGDVTETGILQLKYLSLRMRNEKVDYIYSSSRKRALATAQAVNEYHGLPIHIDDRIIEINAGDWEGKSFAEFPELYPVESELWDSEPYSFIAPNGEKMIDVYNRMKKFVLDKTREHRGSSIAAATHGCAIRNLMCWAKGLDFTRLNEIEWCDNTGINIIDVDDDFVPHVITENNISHLPEEIKFMSRQIWNNN
jgi:broad specificity phosphatase PhoE